MQIVRGSSWQDFLYPILVVKLMFSKKAIYGIFTVDLTTCSKCQIDGEDFVNFCGLLRKPELYHQDWVREILPGDGTRNLARMNHARFAHDPEG